MNALSGIVSFGIMNGDCKVLNNNVLNFSKLPLIKSPRDFEDQYFEASKNERLY